MRRGTAMAGTDGTTLWMVMRDGFAPPQVKGLVALLRELTPADWEAGVAAVQGRAIDGATTGVLIANALQEYERRTRTRLELPDDPNTPEGTDAEG